MRSQSLLKKSFTSRWNSLMTRLRKAAKKSGYRKKDVSRLIAGVRVRARF